MWCLINDLSQISLRISVVIVMLALYYQSNYATHKPSPTNEWGLFHYWFRLVRSSYSETLTCGCFCTQQWSWKQQANKFLESFGPDDVVSDKSASKAVPLCSRSCLRRRPCLVNRYVKCICTGQALTGSLQLGRIWIVYCIGHVLISPLVYCNCWMWDAVYPRQWVCIMNLSC